MHLQRLTAQALGLSVLTAAPFATAATLAAFPGAEGYGAGASGGRGGSVYHVTSLADTNTVGTLRYGLTRALAAGETGRTIVFDVGGRIQLSNNLTATVPNLTIAGQTAPGPGITVSGRQTSIASSNVILRYMSFRASDVNGPLKNSAIKFEGDSLDVFGSATNIVRDVVVDHVSTSWSIDENLSTTWCDRVTVQNSIIAEALNNAGHSDGNGGTSSHSMGTLIGNGSGSVTIARNLYAANATRNPRLGGKYFVQFANNVLYNWGGRLGYSGGDAEGDCQIDFAGNYAIAGPSTSSGHATEMFYSGGLATHVFQDGNIIDGNRNGKVDGTNTAWAMFTGTYTQAGVRLADGSVPLGILTAQQAYSLAVQSAGNSLLRDAVDQRIIQSLIGQTGSIIDSQDQVGGFAEMMTTSRPAGYDTDRDGMPDTWETANGLNRLAADNNMLMANGYTALETYLNTAAVPEPGMVGVFVLAAATASRSVRRWTD